MPAIDSPNFETAREIQEERDTHMPYISKSRLMEYAKNPYHLYLKYIRGLREPENRWMRRGSNIHSVFEDYYHNVREAFEETGDVCDDLTIYLPADYTRWMDYTEPFITNFLMFEARRLQRCCDLDDVSLFPAVGIEAEVWDWNQLIPRMGFADVIVEAASLPDFSADTAGVVVIDFKTGKTPPKKYRNDGIFLELEYYALLFEEEYDVAAVGGYYPMNDDFITAESTEKRRSKVERLCQELEDAGTDVDNYPINPGPLCAWGPNEDQKSSFYHICPCKWATESGPGPTFYSDNKESLESGS
ncbi:PD-(D/E)XK nuclease family protein [Haloplanus salinus]|nr:PD-(D/E)XK nuclease family protein [Haloplanus salinus]